MIWTILIALFVIWLLGLLCGGGPEIHLLLLIAIFVSSFYRIGGRLAAVGKQRSKASRDYAGE